MNKKGQLGIFEILFALVMIFTISIFVIILYYTWSQMSAPLEIALGSAISSNETAFNLTTMNSRITSGVGLFDAMFPFIIIGLIIFSLISAFLSRNNPAFLAVSILVLGITILLGIIFSNVFQALITGTSLQATGDTFSIIKFTMENLPILIGVIAAITIFALFSLGRGGKATGEL